jgi:glycerol-3-phosphate acyltransferase PlsY
MSLVAACLIAFFIGSIPFGFLIARLKGIDVRRFGSGNIGATNVARVVGKQAGAITLALDALKGACGAWLGYQVLTSPSLPTDFFVPLTGITAVFGHCYSPFLKFKGGKGVAAGLGAFLAIAPLPSLIAVAVFAITLKSTKYVSLASISAALSLTLSIIYFAPNTPNLTAVLASLLAAILVISRHRGNIERINDHTEPKFHERS